MHARRFSLALATVLVGLSAATPALAETQHAYTITADKDAGVCKVNPAQEDSPIVEFWARLQADAAAQRLGELEAQVPGIKPAIEAYDHQQPGAKSPGELQEMLTRAGAAEGFGMLAPHRSAAADGVPGAETQPAELTYTAEEAQAAADKIAQDPTRTAQDSLAAQAASGLRIATIEQELFTQRSDEFAQLQQQLRKDLTGCAKELKGTPVGWYALGAVVALGVLVLIVVAVSNARKGNRHGRRQAAR